GGRTGQRFPEGAVRNTTSAAFFLGLPFCSAALITGSATVGYTAFNPEAPDLSGYRGTTAEAGLTYTLLGSTRISGTVTRHVDFSYDVNQPYYLLTGGTISIGQ